MAEKLEYDSPEWKKLVSDIKGVHAQRMNDLLFELPDKQFRIIYPKLLEFVIPKMQRQEVIKRPTNALNVLQIQVVHSAEELNRLNTIDITQEDDEEGDIFDEALNAED